MGSSQCCTKQFQEETSELIISDTPIEQKAKIRKSSQEEVLTPGFADLKSQQSKRSEQNGSQKSIQFIAQIEKVSLDSPLKSQTSVSRKKNDSPIIVFEPKNSLKNFDTQKIKKIQLEIEDNDSQNSKSGKGVLKQELKYSKFKKMDTTFDGINKKVTFQD